MDADLLNPRAVIGDNAPPEPVAEVEPAPEPTFEQEVAGWAAAFAARVEAVADRANSLPKAIDSDDQAARAADVIKDARTLSRELDVDRATRKRPYLEAGRLIDTAFGVLVERMDRIAGTFDRLNGAYQIRKRDEERRIAQEAERRAREEEQRRFEAQRKAEAEGRARHAAQHAAKADDAAEAAERAAAVVRQSTVDATRLRTDSGTVASIAVKWKGEIVDAAALPAAALWPLIPLEAKQKAVDLWVKNNTTKGTTTAPVLAGVRIFEDARTRTR